jgi:glycosyltransferase involved in cell wall biosynthesis
MPTYNNAKYIGRAIESVEKQTYANWELIIVDNFSQDNTSEIVQRHIERSNKIQYYKLSNEGIIARSRNYAIAKASGQLIAFLDSDDWWTCDKLSICAKYLEKADIVFHDLAVYSPKGRRYLRKVRGRTLKSPVFRDLMVNANALPNSSVVLRKYLLDKVNNLSESNDLVAIEDYDLWLRLAQITEKFVHINKVLGSYWVSDTNTSNATDLQIKRISFLYNNYLKYLTREDQKAAVQIMSFHIASMNEKMGRWPEALSYFWTSSHTDNILYKTASIKRIIVLLVKSVIRSINGR